MKPGWPVKRKTVKSSVHNHWIMAAAFTIKYPHPTSKTNNQLENSIFFTKVSCLILSFYSFTKCKMYDFVSKAQKNIIIIVCIGWYFSKSIFVTLWFYARMLFLTVLWLLSYTYWLADYTATTVYYPKSLDLSYNTYCTCVDIHNEQHKVLTVCRYPILVL